MTTILVTEDNHELRELFCMVLEGNGYQTIPAENGAQAFELASSHPIDLMVSDVMMPKMDGYTLVEKLRKSGYDFPILLITVNGNLADKRAGFRAGTDDYMVKPVDVNEMLWRVEALLRRSQARSSNILQIGQTVLNSDALTVTCGETTVECKPKEYQLLHKLLSSCGKIFTRHQLFDEIWGVESETESHTLEVHISRLREKFRDNPDFSIVTVRGLGYKAVKLS
jgi:DNA-binding response OmpR family regulator